MANNKKPTQLKILQGTYRKDRSVKNEVTPKPYLPSPPDHLNEVALVEWDKMGEILYEEGLLTKVDRTAFAAYCEAYSLWVAACEKRNELGSDFLIEYTKNGNAIQSPIVGIINTTRKAVKEYLTEFGMTPAARTRVSAVRREDEMDMFAEFG